MISYCTPKAAKLFRIILTWICDCHTNTVALSSSISLFLSVESLKMISRILFKQFNLLCILSSSFFAIAQVISTELFTHTLVEYRTQKIAKLCKRETEERASEWKTKCIPYKLNGWVLNSRIKWILNFKAQSTKQCPMQCFIAGAAIHPVCLRQLTEKVLEKHRMIMEYLIYLSFGECNSNQLNLAKLLLNEIAHGSDSQSKNHQSFRSDSLISLSN